MAFSIGIDLGTTNTVVSTGRRSVSGGIEVLTEKLPQMDENKKLVFDTLLPSFLYSDMDELCVGKYAKAMKSQSKNNVISNSKNFIGQRNYKWDIDGKIYTPELVASYFLSAIRGFLIDKYGDEDDIKSAVITVPASFDIDQRNFTKTAARLAGFDGDITLISEPTAAVLDFINDQSKIADEDKFIDLSDFKTMLVFDLGGGTCDVAVLKVKILGKEVFLEEVTVSPHTLIGGTNFDAYAVEGIISDYEKENKVKVSELMSKERYEEFKGRLLMSLEDYKVYFSDKYNMKTPSLENRDSVLEKISVQVIEPGVLGGSPFKHKLTMKRYNEYISGLLSESNKKENIIDPINKTLKSCFMDKEDIDYIFCVGGMTRYPKVLETITKYFDKEPLKFIDNMESVSRGASIYHHYDIIDSKADLNELERKAREAYDIIPRLPQTIFLNVKKGFLVPIIKANTKAGTPIIIDKLIKATSETELVLELYSGQSFFDPDLKRLENLKLKFPYAIKRGSGIVLKLEYTEKGVLNFEAYIKDNKNIKINISLEKSQLSNKEILDIQEHYSIGEVGGIY